MQKDIIYLEGTVQKIDELLHIPRDKKPDLYKRTLVFVTESGQKLFPEVRNQRLKSLEKEMIHEGCKAKIGITFEGSEKNDKRYNNIYVNSITKIK